MQEHSESNDTLPSAVPTKSSVKKLDAKQYTADMPKTPKPRSKHVTEGVLSQESMATSESTRPIQMPLSSNLNTSIESDGPPAANSLSERPTPGERQLLGRIEEQEDNQESNVSLPFGGPTKSAITNLVRRQNQSQKPKSTRIQRHHVKDILLTQVSTENHQSLSPVQQSLDSNLSTSIEVNGSPDANMLSERPAHGERRPLTKIVEQEDDNSLEHPDGRLAHASDHLRISSPAILDTASARLIYLLHCAYMAIATLLT